jgi:hypothetical protein
MPAYKFRAHDGAGSEKVGAAVLADDDEAVAFGKRVVAEMMRVDAELYFTWTMEITAGKREVASMSFEAAGA